MDTEQAQPKIQISIHAPRAGGDPRDNTFRDAINLFQSTPPVRGATLRVGMLLSNTVISIHAPRAGGDDEQTA